MKYKSKIKFHDLDIVMYHFHKDISGTPYAVAPFFMCAQYGRNLIGESP